jgi:hypothetical protein
MSKVSTHELDMQIQLSLVAKIRQAAQRYKSEPAEEGSSALLSYIAALEGLAEHIEAKTRGARLAYETELRAERFRKLPMSETSKPRADQRVIQFPAANGTTPLTAA